MLYAFVIVRLDRRDMVWINVTANPTAEWVARQITEAFPWDDAPQYLIRDRDQIYGAVVTCRLRATDPQDPDRPAMSSPEQNSPWSLDVGKKIHFTALPHATPAAIAKLRTLFLNGRPEAFESIPT